MALSLLQKIGILSSLTVTLGGAVFGVDSKYIDKSEMNNKVKVITEKMKAEQQKHAQQYKRMGERINSILISRLKNEIFKLEFKKQASGLTPLDAAMLNRYKQELAKVEK